MKVQALWASGVGVSPLPNVLVILRYNVGLCNNLILYVQNMVACGLSVNALSIHVLTCRLSVNAYRIITVVYSITVNAFEIII